MASAVDAGRGRSTTRGPMGALRCDESSTLRGRSPRRASSPLDLVAPTLRLRRARRDHCPSRVASPSGCRAALRPRPRPRPRPGPRSWSPLTDGVSGLRNEVRRPPDKEPAEHVDP